MATFHCQIKKGKKGSAKLHCDYINREGRYASGKRREELAYKEVGNLPYWAKSASDFFDCVDTFERINGNAYMEFEVALPNELSLEENIKLVKNFINENIGENKVYSFAIHYKKAALDRREDQPHAHIMFSERMMIEKKYCKPPYEFFRRFNRKDIDKGGYEKDQRFTKSLKAGSEEVERVRASWAKNVNRAYISNGLDLEISHLSLEEQKKKLDEVILNQETEMTDKQWQEYIKVNRLPQKHLGPKLAHQMKKDIRKPDMKFDFLFPKARLYMLSKELEKDNIRIKEKLQSIAEDNKEIGRFKNSFKELQEQYEELKKLKASPNMETKQESIVILGDKLIKEFDKMAKELDTAIREKTKKIEELKSEIIPDDRIEKVARSYYTKGKTKELNETLRKLERERIKFENEFNTFSERPLPKMDNAQEKIDYYAVKDRLDKWQEDLIQRESIARNNQEFLIKELSKPEHKENITYIMGVIKIRSERNSIKFNNLAAEIKFLKSVGRNVLQIKRAINNKVKYVIDKSIAKHVSASIDSRDVSDLNNAINKLKNAIDRTQSIQPNNMKVNFHDRSKGRGDDMEL